MCFHWCTFKVKFTMKWKNSKNCFWNSKNDANHKERLIKKKIRVMEKFQETLNINQTENERLFEATRHLFERIEEKFGNNDERFEKNENQASYN